jgi:RNA polymerase sigma-70 factor (sigma-E family)
LRVELEQDFADYVRGRLTRLHRVAYHLLGDRDRADDAVQAALVTLYRRWPRMHAVVNLDAYVHTMVVRACLADRRHWWSRVRLGTAASEVGVEGGGAGVEERMVLRTALHGLPERQRTVLVLRFLCDLPVAEVAALLGRSEGTVKSQTSYGLQALRRALGAQASVPVQQRRPR